MNSTLQELIGLILSLKEANPFLQLLTSTSKTAVWRNILETVAFMIFNFQEALRLHMKEIDEKIASQKVPNEKWYREQALRFQYGFELDPLSYIGAFLGVYEDGNGNIITATEQEIEDSKIIKYASVTPNISGNGVKKISMKIAGENMDEVISDEKALAFKTYIERIQATGDHIVVVNFLPDILLLQYKLCFDPLILYPDGMSIITAEYPVKIAIQNFLKNLPFNGELSVEALEDTIQGVNGVTDLQKLEVSSKWIEPGTGYGLFQPIEISRIPKSGRFKIEDWSGIEYINYQPTE
ncbi:hypothetical protein HNP38_002773 [Chryseobacterium defluvii]|uniref:Nucleotidyltransferase n=1 Tax=Chryseobacterium defluvii TaxID=160396 RepID=A0A840KHP6_9FLAO|nr:nucleotidyltransferase [Chryseobacterium defluvii]MBB4807467.1 hypothetical protein [Chryseobacterium defluvii]